MCAQGRRESTRKGKHVFLTSFTVTYIEEEGDHMGDFLRHFSYTTGRTEAQAEGREAARGLGEEEDVPQLYAWGFWQMSVPQGQGL